MTPDQVKAIVGDLPWMTLERARILTSLILENELKDCLEIGTLHGVGSLYMAAAAQRIGGSLLTVDLPAAADLRPNLPQLIEKSGLNNIRWRFDQHGGAKTLCDAWADGSRFDLVYIDGGHTFEATAAHFLLADLVLRSGGIAALDDIEHPKWPGVKRAWHSVVMRHPGYGEYEARGNFGWRRKL